MKPRYRYNWKTGKCDTLYVNFYSPQGICSWTIDRPVDWSGETLK